MNYSPPAIDYVAIAPMIVIFGALVGAAWGGYLAKKRGGNRLDIAQYAASSAIAFGLLALFASIVLARVL